MRRCTVVLFVAAVLGPAAPVRADHVIETYVRPGEPSRLFPESFVIPEDAQAHGQLYSWSDPRMGGWGGDHEGSAPCPDGHTPRTPVVFVHGTTEDAPTAWTSGLANGITTVNVRDEFLAGGWCARELWAVSYTGARGYLTYNDANADEVYAFIRSVLDHTGASQVDVVAHSLGVTVVRKAIFNHIGTDGLSWLRRFVAIGGANHGSTICRGYTVTGLAQFSHPCAELDPDSPWVAELNSIGETPAGPDYMTIYDSLTDQFYQGPDAQSPRLEGACNIDMPGEQHLPIARGPRAVPIYRAFLDDGTLPPACT